MKRRKVTLEQLAAGVLPLNNEPPPKWLINTLGETPAWAATLFDCTKVERKGVEIRLRDP